MKKILVMVLCLIMAVCPVLAEELPVINIEMVENLAAELGFEGATGEEIILSAGDGYFVLTRADLPSMYVYCPDIGWNAVNAGALDESWAITELCVYASQYDLEPAEFCVEMAEKYGSAAAAVLQLDYCMPVSVYKGNGFVLLKYSTDYIVVDLADYNAHIINGINIRDIFIDSDGQMLCLDSDANLAYIDYDGNVMSYSDLKNKIDYQYIIKIFDTYENMVVVYRGNDGYAYAAWIDKQENIMQNVYLSQSVVYDANILYSEYTDTVIYNTNLAGYCIIVAANRDGKTFAVVSVNTGKKDEVTYRYIYEVVEATADSIKYNSKGRVEGIEGYENIKGNSCMPVSCLVNNGKYAYVLCAGSDGNEINAYMIDLEIVELHKLNTDHIDPMALIELYSRSYSARAKDDNWHGDEYITYHDMVFRIIE